MFPACVAFIVFSSSLLDLIRGNISIEFVFGLILIGMVLAIPFFYRHIRGHKSEGI